MAMKDIAQIADAMREEKKPATLRGYASQWKKFREWCEAEGWEPLPADPYVVARFLIHRHEDGGLAARTMRLLRTEAAQDPANTLVCRRVG